MSAYQHPWTYFSCTSWHLACNILATRQFLHKHGIPSMASALETRISPEQLTSPIGECSRIPGDTGKSAGVFGRWDKKVKVTIVL